MIADVVGYTQLMERDDHGTFARLRTIRDEVVDRAIVAQGGRIVRTTGDGLLAEFTNVLAALRASVEIQREMARRNGSIATDARIDYRIGVALGDIMSDANDIEGDGVNVASRLQTLADPGGICVSSAAREQVHGQLDVAFVDIGQQRVKNLARPIEVYRVALGGEAAAVPRAGRGRWLRLKRGAGWRWLAAGALALGVALVVLWAAPLFWNGAAAPSAPAASVAVLPLTAPPGDAAAAQYAQALTRDLLTGLPRRRPRGLVHVVAGGSPAADANDLRHVGRSLNVRYLLEGDVQRGADGNTVNLRLIDAQTGAQVWSERDTLQEADIAAESSPKLRDLIGRLLRIGLFGAEIHRVSGKPESSLSASELVLRAWAASKEDQSLRGTREAIRLSDAALRLEPNLVPALLLRAALANDEADVDPAVDRDRVGREQEQWTARAVDLDPTDPLAWDERAEALANLGRWDAALEAIAMATKLDPHEPDYYLQKAWVMSMTGRPAQALAFVDQALGLDPPSIAWPMRIACEAHLLSGEAELAVATCEKAAGLGNYWMNNLFLAAAYANQGDLSKAAVARAQVLRTVPDYTLAQLRAKRYSDNPEYLKLAEKYLYAGLRKAGIPEN